MTEEALADDLRAAVRFACRALEAQMLAVGRALDGRLKLAQWRKVSAKCDYVGQRMALWRELLADEPEIVADLEMLAHRPQEFGPRRRSGDPA